MNEFITTEEAATLLSNQLTKCSIHTLIKSRRTGMLWGIKAPAHVKIGRAVRYNSAALKEWIDRMAKIGGSE